MGFVSGSVSRALTFFSVFTLSMLLSAPETVWGQGDPDNSISAGNHAGAVGQSSTIFIFGPQPYPGIHCEINRNQGHAIPGSHGHIDGRIEVHQHTEREETEAVVDRRGKEICRFRSGAIESQIRRLEN